MNKKVIYVIFVLVTIIPGSLFSQGFPDFLEKINSIPASSRNPYCLDYLSKQKAFPITESDTLVHFLYYGKADSVAIAGDASGWRPSLKMQNIDGCDLWYCTASYPADARWEYKIVVDGKNWRLDSLNHKVVHGGMGDNSDLQMPKYLPPAYTVKREGVASGTLIDTMMQSMSLGEGRQFSVYLPSGYRSSDQNYPLVIFHDGFDFLKFLPTPTILDNMIAEKLIPPVIAVFDQPVRRDEEYSGKRQDKYTTYVIKELIPWLDKNFRTMASPGSRALAGISNGGNIALWIGGTNPDVIGNVIAMSSNVEQNVAKAYQSRDARGTKIYMNFGEYDISMLIPRVQKLKTILANKQYIFIYREYPEGHNWRFWEKYLPEALQYIFPKEQ